MPLKLITGPFNSGKTTRLLSMLGEALKGGPAYYVAPNDSIASELRNHYLTSTTSPAAIAGKIFVSFSAFLETIADTHQPILSPGQRALICHRLLATQKLRYFRKDGITLGIAKEASETIATLKRNMITPQKLRDMLETRGTPKENDLLVLFERYEEELASLGVIDRGDICGMAKRRLAERSSRSIREASIFIFDEFFAPDPVVIEIISALRNAAPDKPILVALTLADHPERPYANFADRTIGDFLDIVDEQEKLRAITRSEPEISVISLRSLLQEIRFVAGELIGETHDEPVETTVCCRTGSPFAVDLASEIWNRDRFLQLARSHMSTLSPIIADLLAGPMTDRLPGRAHLSEYADRMQAELCEISPAAGWDADLSDLYSRALASRSFASLTALDAALKSIATSAALFKVGEVTRELFIEHLQEELHSSSMSTTTMATPFPLRIAQFEDSISIPTGRIIMPGMLDGAYPRRIGERIFFADPSEMGAVPNRLLDAIFPSAELELARDAYRFHAWLSKANREVLLTFPTTAESGGESIPSGFLAGLGTITPVEARIPEPVAALAPNFGEELSRTIAIEKERLSGTPLQPEYHGQITADEARELVRQRFLNERLSASRLETYADCPFKFFVEYVLGLKPEEEITKEILPKDRGTIIHTVLERFYRNHGDVFRRAVAGKIDGDETGAIIDRLCEDAFREHAALIAQSSPILHAFQKRAIRTVVGAVISREISDAMELPEPLFPCRCEWSFGTTSHDALTIEIEGEEPALLQGRIDRIDETEGARKFMVVDYKTGRNIESISKDLTTGKHMQLPIYVEAARKLLLRDYVPLGGVLLAVMTAEKKHGFLKKEFNDTNYRISKRSKAILRDDEWHAALDAALGYAATYIAAMRAGKFGLTTDDCPRYCKFSDVCRKKGTETTDHGTS